MEPSFPNGWKVSSVIIVFKNFGERSTAKNYHHVILLSVVSKKFEKLIINRLVADHLQKCELFFSISSMVSGLLFQSKIFWNLYLTEMLGFLMESWATQAAALDISKALGKVWHACHLHELKFYGISSQINGFISSFFSSQFMLVFLKAPLLALHFSYYTLMNFQMMLYGIMLSMLIILLSTLRVIRLLFLNLNLPFETL